MHTSIIIYIVVCKTLSLETQQADYFIDELEEVSSEGLASKRPNASAELSTYYISLGDIKPGFAGDSTTLIFVVMYLLHAYFARFEETITAAISTIHGIWYMVWPGFL